MAWPKGVSRKKKLEPQVDGSVVIQTKSTVEQVAQTVKASSRKKVGLGSRKTDPFTKFKTDEAHFDYRAININKRNIREREAEGWELMGPNEKGELPEYGDLRLAKMPKEDYQEIREEVNEKTARQTKAVNEGFKQEAERAGFQVDDTTTIT